MNCSTSRPRYTAAITAAWPTTQYGKPATHAIDPQEHVGVAAPDRAQPRGDRLRIVDLDGGGARVLEPPAEREHVAGPGPPVDVECTSRSPSPGGPPAAREPEPRASSRRAPTPTPTTNRLSTTSSDRLSSHWPSFEYWNRSRASSPSTESRIELHLEHHAGDRDRRVARPGSRPAPRRARRGSRAIVTWFGVTASDRRASTRVIRIENRQLISASTGPSNDLFMPRISAHSAARRAASSTSSIPAITSARSTRAPSGTARARPDELDRDRQRPRELDRRRRHDRPRRALLRDLAHPPLERGQPADPLRVPIAGRLEEDDALALRVRHVPRHYHRCRLGERPRALSGGAVGDHDEAAARAARVRRGGPAHRGRTAAGGPCGQHRAHRALREDRRRHQPAHRERWLGEGHGARAVVVSLPHAARGARFLAAEPLARGLVFFHRGLSCLVAVELEVRELRRRTTRSSSTRSARSER